MGEWGRTGKREEWRQVVFNYYYFLTKVVREKKKKTTSVLSESLSKFLIKIEVGGCESVGGGEELKNNSRFLDAAIASL